MLRREKILKESKANKTPQLNRIREVVSSQYHPEKNNEIVNFIFDTLSVGVVILNQKMDIVYKNKQASLFLSRFELPEEIPSVGTRIFNAIHREKFQELFPGDIMITKKLEGSPSNWIFRFAVGTSSYAGIILYIIENKVSHKLNVNEIRHHYRLTRREADILRRVMDGLRNTEISEELDIVEQTVKDHLSNIYMKMGVGNRFDLIRSLLSSSSI